VRAKQTDAALVVPAGTSAALAVGQPSQLILYTDPVKMIELDVIPDLVQEIRHELEVAARDEAVAELEATRNRALEARAALDRAAADLRRELDDAARRLAAARSDASRARREGERALSTSLTRLRVEQKAAARAALGSLLHLLRVLVQRARFTAGFVGSAGFRVLDASRWPLCGRHRGSGVRMFHRWHFSQSQEWRRLHRLTDAGFTFAMRTCLKRDECSGSSTLGPSRMILDCHSRFQHP
jgi:hypothetical protein